MKKIHNFRTGKTADYIKKMDSKLEGKEFIVKVQKSIVSSFSAISILMYNQSRSIMEEFDDNKQIARVAECLGRLGDRPKAYFNAQLNETGIKLLEEVKEQSW